MVQFCHAERSEASVCRARQTLSAAKGDTAGLFKRSRTLLQTEPCLSKRGYHFPTLGLFAACAVNFAIALSVTSNPAFRVASLYSRTSIWYSSRRGRRVGLVA